MLRSDPRNLATEKSSISAPASGARFGSVAGLGVVLTIFIASGAQAQNCTNTLVGGVNASSVSGAATSVAANVAGTIAAATTAFLTQSTAFVGAPGDPQPGQPGGGIWTRGVVGEVDIKSTSSNSLALQAPPGTIVPGGAASQPCNTKVHSDFGGVQFGADISRLNVNGWNIHLGLTSGSLYTNNSVVGGSPVGSTSGSAATTQVPFESSSQVPFIGGYAVVTNGGFFADAMIRSDDYQLDLNSAGQNFYGQKLDARGINVSGSVGYNFQIPNSDGWFVEPSAGVLYSKVWVDPLNMAGNLFNFGAPSPGLLSGTTSFDPITQTIGRVGLRAGTSISYGSLTLQPFVAASVWHDFSGDITSNWASTSGLQTCPGPPQCSTRSTAVLTNANSTTNFGTYGQYSLGVSGVTNTGWVGFVRVDYRNGPDLTGWDGTAGVRYQFSPSDLVRETMPVKASVLKARAAETTTWNGLYVGAVAGAELSSAHWGYPGGEAGIAGILGGFDLGYNWQIRPWVFGLEGDWTWTDAKGAVRCAPMSVQPLGTISSPLFAMNCNGEQDWTATITPRIGYEWGRMLMYVKGGAAFTQLRFAATCNFGPLNGVNSPNFVGQSCTPVVSNSPDAFSNGFTASDLLAGWIVGLGVEFPLTRNWSAKAETDYVDFGNRTLIASDGAPVSVGMHMWQAKLGVNYRFNSGPAW
jgi:opacity protein-like surface antigen